MTDEEIQELLNKLDKVIAEISDRVLNLEKKLQEINSKLGG